MYAAFRLTLVLALACAAPVHAQDPAADFPNRPLRQIVPFGIRATANLFGVEGFHLCDVLGVAAVARPSAVAVRSPELGFAAGWMSASRARVRTETRAAWPAAWRSLAKRERRFW